MGEEPKEPQTDWKDLEEEINRRWTKVVEYIIIFAVLITIMGLLGGAFTLVAEILAFALILAIAVVVMVYMFVRPTLPRQGRP